MLSLNYLKKIFPSILTGTKAIGLLTNVIENFKNYVTVKIFNLETKLISHFAYIPTLNKHTKFHQSRGIAIKNESEFSRYKSYTSLIQELTLNIVVETLIVDNRCCENDETLIQIRGNGSILGEDIYWGYI